MSALFYAGAATAPMVRGAAGHHPCALARTPGVRPRSKEYCINPSRFRSSQASARLLADEPTGNQRVATLQVSMEEGTDSTRLKASLRELLRERRKLAQGDDDNFNILDTQQLAETLSGTTQVLTTLLGAVAAVSLLVGGIGTMNIMLVSVTERTREIGLRLAIGAPEREVLLQFLIEAVVLAALGGVIGIVVATGASFGLSVVMGVPYVFNPGINVLAFVFSAGIGVLFGYFPARRAARGAAGSDPGAAARMNAGAQSFDRALPDRGGAGSGT